LIKVKNISVYEGLTVPHHNTLLSVIKWLIRAYPGLIIITEGYRKGSEGCHGTEPLRAVDLRSWIFKDPRKIEKHINENWEYNQKRPGKQVALYHKTETGAYHFHIQVHPNTRRKLWTTKT